MGWFAEATLNRLEAKPRSEWTEDDWEAYSYVQGTFAEARWFELMDAEDECFGVNSTPIEW